MFRFDWGEGASRRWQAHEQGPAACGPAVPTASAFGVVLTSARPTSRGQALCVSFRLGRWCEQTAVLRWCAAKQRDSGGIAVFAEVSRVRHCVCACFSFLSGRKRLLPFLSLAAGFCGKQVPAWMRVFAPASNAEGKVGGMTHPCPAGQGYAAGVRDRRCLPLRGKSASELARLILGVSRGRAGRWGALPIRNGWQARREYGSMPSCAP